MFILYDLIFLIFAIICLPVYLFKGKFHRGFGRRLGIIPRGQKFNGPIWIHAVSVGEAMAVRELAEQIRKNYPSKNLVISTVTATGNKIAQGLAKEGDLVTYLPLDFGFIVKKVIDKINPALFIIAETEIWPNLIFYLYKRNIPVITVNARISDSSFRGYALIKFFISRILNRVRLFCAQTEVDAQRLMALGASAGRVKVTGNMKFDIEVYSDTQIDYGGGRKRLGLGIQDQLLVAGSTHPGEEEMILEVYQELLSDFPCLKLLLAPRHPQRCGSVEKIISGYKFNSVFISRLSASTCFNNTVFVLDTVGQLNSFYAIADIVFVGGSLVKKGGHNILEPAAAGKPVLFGPHMFNFRDITGLFLSHQAAIRVADALDLKDKIADLLNDAQGALELGRRAKQLIIEHQGATLRNAELIKEILA